jgi:hypothetical protein
VNRRAFQRAEAIRRRNKPVNAAQTRKLGRLARIADVEMPVCRTWDQASDAIDRMDTVARQPTLGRMG